MYPGTLRRRVKMRRAVTNALRRDREDRIRDFYDATNRDGRLENYGDGWHWLETGSGEFQYREWMLSKGKARPSKRGE